MSEDSMNEIEPENRHPLHGANQQLLFNGYPSILNEEKTDVDQDGLKDRVFTFKRRSYKEGGYASDAYNL